MIYILNISILIKDILVRKFFFRTKQKYLKMFNYNFQRRNNSSITYRHLFSKIILNFHNKYVEYYRIHINYLCTYNKEIQNYICTYEKDSTHTYKLCTLKNISI